jgi:hypothetical protein
MSDNVHHLPTTNAQITMPGEITPTARIRAAEICRRAKWTPHICDEIEQGLHDGYTIVQACAHIEKLEMAIIDYEEARHRHVTLAIDEAMDDHLDSSIHMHFLACNGFPPKEEIGR